MIFNPRSGRNARDPGILERARRFVAEAPCEVRLHFTEAPRHATALADQAVQAGFDRIVAIGGDGTLNEVAAALVGTPVALGLIPCGSGNGLGRHLGIPGPGRGAFRNLLSGRIRSIDTGVAAGVPFFNAMGVGFDAELSQRFNRLTRRGLPAYARTTASLLRGYRAETYGIESGGRVHELRAFIVAVANSDQYGNDCFIAPGALIDDGALDLTALPPVGWLTALPLAARLFRGTLKRDRSVHMARGTRFVLHRAKAGPFHTDGEVHEGPADLTVQVRPASLHILVPPPVTIP